MWSNDTIAGLIGLVGLIAMFGNHLIGKRLRKEEQITFDILGCRQEERPMALRQFLLLAKSPSEVEQIARVWVGTHYRYAKRWWEAHQRGLPA